MTDDQRLLIELMSLLRDCHARIAGDCGSTRKAEADGFLGIIREAIHKVENRLEALGVYDEQDHD